MADVNQHAAVVRDAFTQQAAAYAAAPAVLDTVRIARLMDLAVPFRVQRALDVATGPGVVALALAERAHEVVGIDLTDAPLALAEQRRDAYGVANLRFEGADAQHLPFATGEFDVVVCRFAWHHFAEPRAVLNEMVRVCRRGGTVAVEDLIVSEHPERAAYQNRFEHLRDPSHTVAFPLSHLLNLFTVAGVEIAHVHTDQLLQVVEEWLQRAHTLPEQAREVRQMLEQDMHVDLSGTQPFRNAAGDLCFVQRTAIIAGRTLDQ